ncbi:MAG: class II fumarate hydratase [Bacteroidales bacterium]|jgi:fumarate hydratase class II|nr:class II fumarate hydratase [Bacteroidales bacterium]
MKDKYRIEKDTIGEVKVENTKYWGAQTQRSLENFRIGDKMPIEIIKAMALLKETCAKANYELGKISSKKNELIAKVCEEILSDKLSDNFPLVVWQTGSGTQTNMNLNEVIANRAHELNGGKLTDLKKFLHPNDDVNKSQSSNDTFPTAMHIAAYIILEKKFLPAIIELTEVFKRKTKEFENAIKIGRTHLMDATPITFGQEFSGYVAQLEHGIESLSRAKIKLLELAIGGTAVGTGLNAPKNFDKLVCKYLNEKTGFEFVPAKNKFEALATHDAMVENHGVLKQIAVSLMKIGNDIRLMASGPRCGFSELIIPANEPGSSIMPGKVNPTQIEALTMVCAQITGNDIAITIGGMNGQFELNVYKPLIIKNFIESSNLLAEVCLSFSRNCVEGLNINFDKIKYYTENSLMLVTALNEKIGYEKSAIIAKKAYSENITLKQAAILTGLISEQEFDEYVQIEKMV